MKTSPPITPPMITLSEELDEWDVEEVTGNELAVEVGVLVFASVPVADTAIALIENVAD